MALARGVRGLFGRTTTADPPHLVAPPLPRTRWDNVGLAVDRVLHQFVDAAKAVPGVTRIDAKSSGPTVHFLIAADRPREEIVEEIEALLYPIAQAGELPTLDYHVHDGREGGGIPLGYVTVYPD